MAGQQLVLVLDACLSFRLARMLSGYYSNHPSLTFKALEDLYGRGTPDREWLESLPDTPPHVVLTKDEALLRESGQLQAWIKGGLTVVIFGPDFANLARDDMAIALLRWLPTIMRTVMKHPRGHAFAVPSAFRRIDLLPPYTPRLHRRRPRRAKATPKTLDAPLRVERAVSHDGAQLSLPLTGRKIAQNAGPSTAPEQASPPREADSAE